MPPPEDPRPGPGPRPKPPKPKPKPKPPQPRRDSERAQTAGGAPFPANPLACLDSCSVECADQGLCPPPPAPPSATLHLRSSRLPTPLIALSASILAVSVLLLIVLVVCHLVRRRRQRAALQQMPLAHHHNEHGVPAPAAAVEDAEDGGGDGVHHVWYIKTVGLDERAIAAITALVYDGKKKLGGGDGDGGCAVCLGEFRDGETLRLLPRCRHAFHRGCIDPWLRAHVNCPLCRAPVQAPTGNAVSGAAGPAAPRRAPATNLGVIGGGAGAEEADGNGAPPERGVRRAASMVALPRRAWPDVSLREPASNDVREGEMGLGKISRLLKLSEALEMAGMGIGRSVSFGGSSCLRLPGRPGASATTDEIPR